MSKKGFNETATLRLDMHVDDVLLQVERVGEGLPAVVAQPVVVGVDLINMLRR